MVFPNRSKRSELPLPSSSTTPVSKEAFDKTKIGLLAGLVRPRTIFRGEISVVILHVNINIGQGHLMLFRGANVQPELAVNPINPNRR
jgi:hypothetical protein